MAEISHLEDRHDVIFSAEGGPIWIKFRRLVQNDMSTAVMWSNSKPDVEFQYGGRLGEFNGMSSQSHLAHCRVLPLGEFTVTIPEPHIPECKNSIRHIENRFSPYFIFCFSCSLGFDEWRLSYRLRYTCLIVFCVEMTCSSRTVIIAR